MKPTQLPAILAALSAVAFAQVPEQINYQGRVAVSGVNFNGTGQFKFALVDALVIKATAIPVIGDNGDGQGPRLLAITLTSPGGTYIVPPTVTINHPTATGATAHAVLFGTGNLSEIIVDNDGFGQGYDAQTTVTLSDPPENISPFTTWSNDGTSNFGSEPAAAVSLNVTNGLYSVRLGDTTLHNMLNSISPGVGNVGPLKLRVWFNDGTHGSQLLTPDQPLASVPWALSAATAATAATVSDGAIGTSQLEEGSVNSSKVGAGAITPVKLLASAAPLPGQVPRFNGTQFEWVTQTLSLPFSGSVNSANPGISITNTELSGTAISGISSVNHFGDPGGIGVSGRVLSLTSGTGVQGISEGWGNGVEGLAVAGNGVTGKTTGQSQSGVIGYATAANSTGVHGTSALHHGVYAYTGSTNNAALWATAPNGAEGVHAQSDGGDGVVGYTGSAAKAGVFGFSVAGNGVAGNAHGADKSGVFGWSDNVFGYGGYFKNLSYNVNTGNTGLALKVEGHTEVDTLDATNGAAMNGIRVYAGDSTNILISTLLGIPLGTISHEKLWCQKDVEVRGNILHHGSIQNLSDERLKDIKGDYERGLADIAQLHTLRYSFKPGTDAPAGEPRVGVTAQALRKVMPEAVTEDPDGHLLMSTEPVFWAMVNSIKELKAQNQALKKRLDAMEEKLK